jgi:hypothetical protein
VVLLALAGAIAAQTPVVQAPTPASGGKARELAAALSARKLEAFAARDPDKAGRFVAVLHVPGAQLLVVAADYSRATDIEYRLYHKDYMTAYAELNSSTLAGERVFVEDAVGDGLMVVPGKGLAPDTVTSPKGRQSFDGDFADPRRRNQKKISQEDYYRAFSDADQTYTRLLGILVDAVAKAGGSGLRGPLAAGARLR